MRCFQHRIFQKWGFQTGSYTVNAIKNPEKQDFFEWGRLLQLVAPSPDLTLQRFCPTLRVFSIASVVDLLDWLSCSLQQGYTHLLLDLRNVSFMDTMGLSGLITAHRMVQRFGANLSLCSLNGQARMLFEMTEMTSWFNIYPSDPGAEPLEASATVLRPSQFNQNWSFPREETPVPTLDKV